MVELKQKRLSRIAVLLAVVEELEADLRYTAEEVVMENCWELDTANRLRDAIKAYKRGR